MAEPPHSGAALLLEGVLLRLPAGLRWLEACERTGPAAGILQSETA
jgi:hypothetical protein